MNNKLTLEERETIMGILFPTFTYEMVASSQNLTEEAIIEVLNYHNIPTTKDRPFYFISTIDYPGLNKTIHEKIKTTIINHINDLENNQG